MSRILCSCCAVRCGRFLPRIAFIVTLSHLSLSFFLSLRERLLLIVWTLFLIVWCSFFFFFS